MAKRKKKEDPAEAKEGKQRGEKYAETPTGQAQRWSSEFAQSKEFHRKWREAGKVAVSKYLARDMSTTDPAAPGYNLNLFAANINTLMSMLYGKVPQVSVDRRWADADDTVSRIASEMATRCLNGDIEASGYDFSAILRGTLQDRLLPGVGVARIRYSCDIQEAGDDDEDPIESDAKPDGDDVAEGGVEPEEKKEDEWIDDEYVPWQDVLWSPCRYWAEMRWIAFKLYKDKEEVIEFLGGNEEARKTASQLDYNSKAPLENATQKTSENWDKCEIWEIWDKKKKKVVWWVEGFQKTLKEVDDPLELEGFYPCPPFLIANVTTMEYVPKSDYSFAASLYREVDRLEERIALLTMAIKVVGVYDKKAGPDVGRLINETAENKLIPVDAWAAFAERGGIKGSIEFMPIEQIANVIQVLQQQQQSRIQQLFQITGMSDILRGQSDGDKPASATEQQIKVKFASVRIQSLQDEFTRFATDLQKLRFELMCKHFDVETIIRNSNMMNTADGRDTPELVLQAAEFMKNDHSAKWRIQIQPESMAMVDYAQLKQERTEYINSLGIFLQSSFPVAEKFPEATPILMELLKWGLAGFKGSKEIEGVMDRAISAMEKSSKNPPPKPPDPMVQKVQMEMQQDQQNHQAKMAQLQQESADKRAQDQQKFAMEMKEMQADFTAKMAELRMQMQRTHHETQAHVTRAQADQQTAAAQGAADVQTANAKAITAAAQANIDKQTAAREAQGLNLGPEEPAGE